MNEMRHAGMGWPTGAVTDESGSETNEPILRLPGSVFLLCEPQARWWYGQVKERRPDALTLWRAIARQGERPAEIGWSARRFVTYSAVSIQEYVQQGRGPWPTDIILTNEYDLAPERGDNEPDTDPAFWRGRHAKIAAFHEAVLGEWRGRGLGGNLWYHPYAPGHGHHDNADLWAPVAEQFHGVVFHAYTDWETIEAEYRWYRAWFPNTPLLLGEWNTDGFGGDRVTEERRILEGLARLCADDPNFSACYFVWRWEGGPRSDFDVWGHPDRLALFLAPPVPHPVEPPTEVPVPTRDDILQISDAAADAAGIPRLLLRACGEAESGMRADARRPADASHDADYWPDVSGGAWQQTVRYDPDYQGGNAYPGPEEVARVLALQYDPVRSARVAASTLRGHYDPSEPDAILRALRRYNWPAGNGEPANMAVESNYREGIQRAAAEMGVPVPWSYDPRMIVIPQTDDWTCSLRSLEWLLHSVGRQADWAWLKMQLVPKYVTPEQGLLDGTGTGLAQWIRETYGYDVRSRPLVSFDDVAAIAGQGPVLLGGHGWYHWVGVRAYEEDRLLLANPADGYQGVCQALTRDDFDRLGPFSMVWLASGQDEAPPVVTPPERDCAAELAQQEGINRELAAQVAEKDRRLSGLVGAVAVLNDDMIQQYAGRTLPKRVAKAAAAIRHQFLDS